MNEYGDTQSHPDDTQLDLLRAGLLDQTLRHKTLLLHHLAGCAFCRQRLARWKQLAETGLSGNEELSRQLRERRQLALAGRRSRQSRGDTTRMMVAAIAATIILSLGTIIGLQMLRPSVPRAEMAQADRVPDLYSHIDFYLWVSRQGAPEGGRDSRS